MWGFSIINHYRLPSRLGHYDIIYDGVLKNSTVVSVVVDCAFIKLSLPAGKCSTDIQSGLQGMKVPSNHERGVHLA